MRLGLRPRTDDRPPRDRGGGNSGIVDDPVADHLDDIGLDRHRIGSHLRDLPGQLIGTSEMII